MNKRTPHKKLFIIVNVDWFFLSHRLPIAIAGQKNGFDVTILAKDSGCRREIESYGLKFIDIPFERSGSNPLHELKCISLLYKIYKKEKPTVIHHVTLKATLLGCIAAKMAGIGAVVNAISGFGYNFTDGRDGLSQKIIKQIMSLGFRSNKFHFIFQNPDDIHQFKKLNLVKAEHIHLIKGSGIDLNKFQFQEPYEKKIIRVILPARMLYDKGIIEFIDAARIIKKEVEGKAEFILVGDCDMINLAGISEKELYSKIDQKYIRWIGFQKDMYAILCDSDIVVLPSYREGLPKALIEACAVGRPIVTTDTEGCRECVVDGYNGFLVPVKNATILAEKILQLIQNPSLKKEMGINARTLAEAEFSIESVIEKHIKIYEELNSLKR